MSTGKTHKLTLKKSDDILGVITFENQEKLRDLLSGFHLNHESVEFKQGIDEVFVELAPNE